MENGRSRDIADVHAVSPYKKDVLGALAVGFAGLFISTFPALPAFARERVSQKHEIDCVNKKTKMSLVYVFRWQAFETGQNAGRGPGDSKANKREMMQRQNGVEIDKERGEIKNGIHSLVAFAVCQFIANWLWREALSVQNW